MKKILSLLFLCLFSVGWVWGDIATSITSYADGTYYVIDVYNDTAFYAMSGFVSSKVVSAVRVNAAITTNSDGTITLDLNNAVLKSAMQYTFTTDGDSISIKQGTNSICLKSGGNDLAASGYRWLIPTVYPRDTTVASYKKRFTIPTSGTSSKSKATQNCLLLCHTTYAVTNKVATRTYKPQFKGYVQANRDIKTGNVNYYGSGYFYLVPTTAGSTKTTLSTPTNLSTSELSQTGVKLGWDAVTNAGSYKVEYKVSTASSWTEVSPAPTTDSCTLSGLTASTTYAWQVTAIASNSSTHNNSSAASGTNFTTNSYTVTAATNNEELGTVSGTTSITATPKECVGYESPAYTVSRGTATVQQNGNTFTVSNMSANVTVTIKFAALQSDTYVDGVQSETMDGNYCGTYSAPSITDKSEKTSGTCEETHYHFMGWVTAANKSNPTDSNIIKSGTSMTANGTTYYAVWAAKDTSK